MNKEKELYEELYTKQMRYIKLVLCLVFGVIGILFSLLGVLLISEIIVDSEGTESGIVLLSIGIIFVFTTLILSFVPFKGNYERFKKRTDKYGFSDQFDAMIKLAMLDKKCQELEKRIEELE